MTHAEVHHHDNAALPCRITLTLGEGEYALLTRIIKDEIFHSLLYEHEYRTLQLLYLDLKLRGRSACHT